jgi:acetylornithine deacetylase/succinyl-diaminopimelate desuccinylase-like protein
LSCEHALKKDWTMLLYDETQFQAYLDQNRERFRDELFEFLRLRSITAQGIGMEETAAYVAQRLEAIGAKVQVLRLPGAAPLVLGTIGSGERTMMFYDHYDVQPAEPLELWETPAFEPSERDGKWFARGVADDKGGLLMRIQAVEALQATMGQLPLQIKFLIEGEEEIGSPNLSLYCQEYAHLMQADACLWESGGANALGQQQITCGSKGLLYVELIARGPAYDLHSANASMIENPAWRLTWALASIKDRDDRILIPGFYDRVRDLTESELQALAALPNDDEQVLKSFGVDHFINHRQGLERMKAHLFTPTANICGVGSGYTEEGIKTVLPAEARAKMDFRLVPDMDPYEIEQLLRAHLDANGFDDIELKVLSHAYPSRSPVDSPLVQVAAKAIEHVFGHAPIVYPSVAGTGPTALLRRTLNLDICSAIGVVHPDCKMHSPNENINAADYWSAMIGTAAFLSLFSQS